ncbi:hypothetical protein IQK56_02090 [Pseudomonas sp. MAFF 301449]|uniref:Site-specific integrase n=1 Tax=Pseudomonas cyclaminis TaxID=2781239 RepID=A0ABR9SLM4_9PSED|nr:hypothetical protein [Pseudomonas cyclaminis]MBE8589808.1 hypothetical protein [Pseudomonas cyclaminis]MBE8598810.1 hypothetical protein [Pseudomonas cyclaminis]
MSKININSFPENFSTLEQCQLLALLEEANSATKIYNGDYTAPWLISSIHAEIWQLRKGEETRYVDGTLKDHYEYKWSTKLYDGSNLVDPKNRKLLHDIQRLTFLVRELPGGPATLTTLKSFIWSLNFLVRWMFVHGNELDPCKHSLTQLKQQHFINLFNDLAKGGTAFALRYPERLLISLFPLALDRAPFQEELDEPLDLSIETCFLVSRWLTDKGYMVNKDRSVGKKVLSPSSVAQLIDVDADTVSGGPKWRAFLLQFQSSENFSITGSDLIISGSTCRREFPTQRTATKSEAKSQLISEKTLDKYLSDIKYIIALYRHLPKICPNPMTFNTKEIRQKIITLTSAAKHTPWIPLPIAMTYTNEALRWVHLYGEDLVSVFLEAYKTLYEHGLLVSAPAPGVENPSAAELAFFSKQFTKKREDIISSIPFPESISHLNIKGMGCYGSIKGKKAFEKLRKSPSLMDAITVLIGAITIIVTMTKPMRESEFRSLKNNCIQFVSGDGYWLRQDIRKKYINGVLLQNSRPIPAISARAIQLLQRLTNGIKKILGTSDPWFLDSLVTLPSFGVFEASVSIPSSTRLLQIFDAFCDYVAIAPDPQGRRWYLRVHEMRKSFLITFFWSFRYASLDASRWIAGHDDVSHIYAYIQANFPGEELPALEAEYASKILREYQELGTPTGTKNVDALYQAVCTHFSVRDVSWIDESILKDWLELQFETHEFEIMPHSIKCPDGGLNTEISFRVSPAKTKVDNHG